MRNLVLGFFSITALFITACNFTGEDNNKLVDNKTEYQKPSIKSGQIDAQIIHSDPALSGPVLLQAKISPNGEMVTVLQGRDDDFFQQDLWGYNLKTGEGKRLVSSTDLLGVPEILSEEEKNRRERARIKASGIVEYSWDLKGEKLLFPLGGDVYIYDIASKSSKRITNTSSYETDAKISPSGKYVSYVRDNDLFITELQSGRETRLSYGANDYIRNATASFVVQEELDRFTGYWVSPDEKTIAYTQIDESPIAIEHRLEFYPDGIKNIAQRYPFTGTDNATIKLGIVPIEGGKTIWADIGDDADIYLARVYWSADSKTLYAGILSRDQKKLQMLAIDPKTGKSRILFTETSPTWLNVENGFVPLSEGGFLWLSERTGFSHIYLYDKNGQNPKQLTKGKWPVTGLNCVSEKTGKIYFTGWQKSALERHIYVVDFDGKNIKQISKNEGWHSASFARNCQSYIGTFSNKSTPPQTRAYNNDGSPLVWLNENRLDESHPYWPYIKSHIVPEYGQIQADDGTYMDYELYKPQNMQKGKKYPAITIVYGGPGVQRIHKAWDDKVYLPQALADLGFVVFKLENRGAGGRGKKFEDHIYRNMAGVEVKDQIEGARFLKSLDFVDADRMGIYGWSYGGYMVLHMLAQTNEYKVGVSGAPVTDWALYDTAYTERYLGDPRKDNPNHTEGAYERASVFSHLQGLEEPVLLIHGMADDNVIFRHSIKLADSMQKLGRHNLRTMFYPSQKHGFTDKQAKIHRDQEIMDFFVKHLTP